MDDTKVINIQEHLQELETKYQHKTTLVELENLGDKMIGLRLYIECYDRSYIGTLKHYFKKGSRIWMERAFIVPSAIPILSVLTILSCDIREITILGVDRIARKRLDKEKAFQLAKARKLKMAQILNEGRNTEEDDEDDFFAKQAVDDDENIPIEDTHEVVLPRSFDNSSRASQQVIIEAAENVAQCFMEIQGFPVVSIVAHGFNLNRDGTLAWLTFGTRNTVYHFNILVIEISVLLQNGMDEFLANESIEKVIHDARFIQDYLQNRYGIGITNVFDTQATDIHLEYKSTRKIPVVTRNAQEIFMQYLQFDEEFEDLSFSLPDDSVWLEQPLHSRLISSLFASAVLLLELRRSMMSSLLADVRKVTSRFGQILAEQNPEGHAPLVEPLIIPEPILKILQNRK